MSDWLILAGIIAAIAAAGTAMYWIMELLQRRDDRRFARRMVQGFDHDVAKLGMGRHDDE